MSLDHWVIRDALSPDLLAGTEIAVIELCSRKFALSCCCLQPVLVTACIVIIGESLLSHKNVRSSVAEVEPIASHVEFLQSSPNFARKFKLNNWLRHSRFGVSACLSS